MIEDKDFMFFDYKEVHEFITKKVDLKVVEKEKQEALNEENKRKEEDAKIFEEANIQISAGGVKTLAELVPSIIKNRSIFKRNTRKIAAMSSLNDSEHGCETNRALNENDDMRKTGDNRLMNEYNVSVLTPKSRKSSSKRGSSVSINLEALEKDGCADPSTSKFTHVLIVVTSSTWFLKNTRWSTNPRYNFRT